MGGRPALPGRKICPGPRCMMVRMCAYINSALWQWLVVASLSGYKHRCVLGIDMRVP